MFPIFPLSIDMKTHKPKYGYDEVSPQKGI